ncbi:MAG: hypothetical protein HKN37_12900 [Rhodothermales bacterium]|nr:hypothetical protein [Rhodothermales bacterium]
MTDFTSISFTTAPTLEVYDTAWQWGAKGTPNAAEKYARELKRIRPSGRSFDGAWTFPFHHPNAHIWSRWHGEQLGYRDTGGNLYFRDGYVQRLRQMFDRFAAHGAKIGFGLIWQNSYLPGGDPNHGVAGLIHAGNAAAFGRQVMDRVGDHPAIDHWIVGGDAGSNNTDANIEVWRTMVPAFEGDGRRIVYHSPTSHGSESDPNNTYRHLNYQNEGDWLDVAALETGHRQSATITEQQLRRGVETYNPKGIDVWAGEPRYTGYLGPSDKWPYENYGKDVAVADAKAALRAGVTGYVFGTWARWTWQYQGFDPDNPQNSFSDIEDAVLEVFASGESEPEPEPEPPTPEPPAPEPPAPEPPAPTPPPEEPMTNFTPNPSHYIETGPYEHNWGGYGWHMARHHAAHKNVTVYLDLLPTDLNRNQFKGGWEHHDNNHFSDREMVWIWEANHPPATDPTPDDPEPPTDGIPKLKVSEIIDRTLPGGHDVPKLAWGPLEQATGGKYSDVGEGWKDGNRTIEFRFAILPSVDDAIQPSTARIVSSHAALYVYAGGTWKKGFDVRLDGLGEGAYYGNSSTPDTNPFPYGKGGVFWDFRGGPHNESAAPWKQSAQMIHAWAGKRYQPDANVTAMLTVQRFRLEGDDADLYVQNGIDYWPPGQHAIVGGAGIGNARRITRDGMWASWLTLPAGVPRETYGDYLRWMEANPFPEWMNIDNDVTIIDPDPVPIPIPPDPDPAPIPIPPDPDPIPDPSVVEVNRETIASIADRLEGLVREMDDLL